MSTPENSTYRDLAERIFNLRFEAMPLWLDDDTIAYLDDRSGVMHLFSVDLGSGERRQLTSGDERIQSLYGTSGSKTVVVGTDAGGNERQQLKAIDLDSGAERMLTSDPDLMHEPFLVTPDGSTVIFRVNDGASGEFSLYRMPIAGGESTCIWDDAGQVHAHAVNDRGDALVSLLMSNMDADLYLISKEGKRTPLLQAEEESWILDASFGPSGEDALVLTNAGRDFVALVRINLSSGEMASLVHEEADIEAFAVSPDGARIAWSVNRDGYSEVATAEWGRLDDVVKANLPDGVVDRLSWSPDSSAFVVGWTPTTGPARIYRVDLAGTASEAFDAEPNDIAFTGVAPELIHFETFDGRQIPAFWFEAEDHRAPVVIDVHGGPESQRRAGFHPVLQHLAASGFHVLTTNVRGSTGYGKAYSHLDDVDLRMDSVRDLPHAHQWITRRLPGSDDRIGIVGQSYGGFMTLSAITEYPDIWFAAVDVVGIANFVTFLERTGPWRRRHRSAEYGSLEQNRDLLERISPIRKVNEIKAPLLVIHGRNDPRVPLHEAEQLVASLEQRNHQVDSLVFDNEGHGLSKRPNRIVGYTRVAEFFWDIANGDGGGMAAT